MGIQWADNIQQLKIEVNVSGSCRYLQQRLNVRSWQGNGIVKIMKQE